MGDDDGEDEIEDENGQKDENGGSDKLDMKKINI